MVSGHLSINSAELTDPSAEPVESSLPVRGAPESQRPRGTSTLVVRPLCRRVFLFCRPRRRLIANSSSMLVGTVASLGDRDTCPIMRRRPSSLEMHAGPCASDVFCGVLTQKEFELEPHPFRNLVLRGSVSHWMSPLFGAGDIGQRRKIRKAAHGVVGPENSGPHLP